MLHNLCILSKPLHIYKLALNRQEKRANPRQEQKQWDWISGVESDTLGINSLRILTYIFGR